MIILVLASAVVVIVALRVLAILIEPAGTDATAGWPASVQARQRGPPVPPPQPNVITAGAMSPPCKSNREHNSCPSSRPVRQLAPAVRPSYRHQGAAPIETLHHPEYR